MPPCIANTADRMPCESCVSVAVDRFRQNAKQPDYCHCVYLCTRTFCINKKCKEYVHTVFWQRKYALLCIFMADFWPTEKSFVLALFNPYVKNQYIKGEKPRCRTINCGFCTRDVGFSTSRFYSAFRRSDQNTSFLLVLRFDSKKFGYVSKSLYLAH